MKKNEFFEEVKNKFVSSDIKVDKIRLDELNKHSLYKWKVLLNVFGFSNEKYTLGNNKVYLTIVSLMDFEEGHMKFFDEFLRRYFFIENYEILEFKTEKCEEGVTAFTRLVIDPSNERVLIVM